MRNKNVFLSLFGTIRVVLLVSLFLYEVHVFIFVLNSCSGFKRNGFLKKGNENSFEARDVDSTECCLNLQFRANIGRIQICSLIFFKTETSGTRTSFSLMVFPGRL